MTIDDIANVRDVTEGEAPRDDEPVEDLDEAKKITIHYEIGKDWAERHKTWSGKVSTQAFDVKDGKFEESLVTKLDDRFCRFLVAGDLDGDGKPDVAVANLSQSVISLLRNTSVPGRIDTV